MGSKCRNCASREFRHRTSHGCVRSMAEDGADCCGHVVERPQLLLFASGEGRLGGLRHRLDQVSCGEGARGRICISIARAEQACENPEITRAALADALHLAIVREAMLKGVANTFVLPTLALQTSLSCEPRVRVRSLDGWKRRSRHGCSQRPAAVRESHYRLRVT